MASDIALIVTCHEPYLGLLEEALASIERQWPAPAECVVMLDGCSPPSFIGDRWRRLMV